MCREWERGRISQNITTGLLSQKSSADSYFENEESFAWLVIVFAKDFETNTPNHFTKHEQIYLHRQPQAFRLIRHKTSKPLHPTWPWQGHNRTEPSNGQNVHRTRLQHVLLLRQYKKTHPPTEINPDHKTQNQCSGFKTTPTDRQNYAPSTVQEHLYRLNSRGVILCENPGQRETISLLNILWRRR